MRSDTPCRKRVYSLGDVPVQRLSCFPPNDMESLGFKSELSVLLLATSLLLLLLGQSVAAPGDEYERCPVPEYPVNVKVLMDSWRYHTLIAEDGGNRVWTAFTTEGRRMWSSQGTCNGSSVSVCSGGWEGKWLHTQFINKALPSPNTYPVRIFVNVTYSFMSCPRQDCDDNFELLLANHGTAYQYYEGGIMPDNRIQHASNVSSGTKQFFFDSETSFAGFFLALRSFEACVTVSRVLVYRYECPGHDRLSTDLLRRPATPAPVCGSVVVRPSNIRVCDVSPYKTLMCTSQGVWLVCEGVENEFICKESKSNLTDMTSTIPSSPTPSPAPDQTSVMGGSTAVEDGGCELPTALLAIVVVLIVAIFGLIVLVVALIVALARTNRKLKPSPKESNDGELSNPVYDPLACNVTSTARVTTNDNGTTDRDDDDQTLHRFSNILYHTPQILSSNTSAVS